VVAVIAGHIWPPQLQFRGGRGIATVTGAVALLDPVLALILMGLAGGVLIFRRGVIFSGLFAFFAMPTVAYLLGRPEHWVVALTGISIMILFAHRAYIRAAVETTVAQREA
jgi:glycerol-3-phosphate acyltransferase PlsY